LDFREVVAKREPMLREVVSGDPQFICIQSRRHAFDQKRSSRRSDESSRSERQQGGIIAGRRVGMAMIDISDQKSVVLAVGADIGRVGPARHHLDASSLKPDRWCRIPHQSKNCI
jgi:hypothetical protein